jgi:ferredoxin
MRVWIDQDQCMGAGTCELIAPEVFHPLSDGTWTVKENAEFFGVTTVFDGGAGGGHGPLGVRGMARVPAQLTDAIVDVVEQCPGECIYVEA